MPQNCSHGCPHNKHPADTKGMVRRNNHSTSPPLHILRNILNLRCNTGLLS